MFSAADFAHLRHRKTLKIEKSSLTKTFFWFLAMILGLIRAQLTITDEFSNFSDLPAQISTILNQSITTFLCHFSPQVNSENLKWAAAK
jgi:hypothetical protein